MKDDTIYIAQILDAIQKIDTFTVGYTKESFFEDQKTQSATIMQLALIGELAKRVSDAKKTTINLPWKDIASFRDRVIHDYYNVDVEIVWKTITDDIPFLKGVLLGHVC